MSATAPALSTRPNIKPTASELPSNENAANARLKALPTSAQAKFERLRRAELRSRALIDGLLDEAERVRENLHITQRELAIFDRHWEPQFEIVQDEKTGTRTKVPVEYPERAALNERIEVAKVELQRLTDEQRAAHLGYSTVDLLDWLASQSAKFIAAPVKLAKTDNLTDALKRNRDQQTIANNELLAVQNAGLTIAEAKAAMRAEVAAIVEKGRPDAYSLFHGNPIEWPTELFIANGAGVHQHTVAATVKDAFALAIWANADAVIAKLDTEIERMGDDASALSRDAQAARIVECEANLLKLQRQEEAIVEALEVQGHQVRRICADPQILLGIERAKS